MALLRIDDNTMQRLRIFTASENFGQTYGNTGRTAAIAINEYIDCKEKEKLQ